MQVVRHVQNHHRRQAKRQDRRGQYQVTAEVGAIQYQQHGVGPGNSGISPLSTSWVTLLIFGPRLQAVDAGQIHQRDFAAAVQFGAADALLDRDAGEVGDLLAKAGQPIE